LPHPQGPRGTGNLKFTIYVPLVPKMHYTKFEKNWSSGYQEEVKNVQMLTHYLSCLAPPWGQKRYPKDYNFTILVEVFLLYITMHSVFFSTYAVIEIKIFENWSILDS
jgi:hypothetical protein